MTKLEALLTAADDETKALAFQLAFPEKKKAALLIAKLLLQETSLDLNKDKAATTLDVSRTTVHDWLDNVTCDDLLGRRKSVKGGN
jgi:hypothetical protein